jgi:hypothetical protein
MAVVEPAPERAQRIVARVFWGCAGLTLMIGVFLVVDVVKSAGSYGTLAWVGVALSAVAILGLVALYAGCALGRVDLGRRVVGKLNLFQLSALGLVLAVGADILIPGRDTGGLALLLPWGITYWLHNLNREPKQ